MRSCTRRYDATFALPISSRGTKLKHFLKPFQADKWDACQQEQQEWSKLFDAALEAYNHQIDSIRGNIPVEVQGICPPFYVDDALVAQLEWSGNELDLTMTLRCGNIPEGYFDLVLKYGSVEIGSEDKQTLIRIAKSTVSGTNFESDCYCHEIDLVTDGRIEHRMLFNCGCWIRIICKSLGVERIDKTDREIPRLYQRIITGR